MKAADIALVAFEKLLDIVSHRLRGEIQKTIAGPEHVITAMVDAALAKLRAEFTEAVIALRFDVMEVQCELLDIGALQLANAAQLGLARGRLIAEGMDIEVMPLCARCSRGRAEHDPVSGAIPNGVCSGWLEHE